MKQLTDFIAHAQKKGMDHQTIRMVLKSAGWKEKEVAEALIAQSLDMEVPIPPDKAGAREAFLHLLTFVLLYISIISLIVLYFNYSDNLFPDAVFDSNYNSYPGSLSTIRFSLAAIIVAFPMYMWLQSILLKEMRLHPDKAWSAIRRWLTYITLLITALVMVGDTIALLMGLLEGELTARFVSKVGIVFALTGLPFLYYFFSVRAPTTK